MEYALYFCLLLHPIYGIDAGYTVIEREGGSVYVLAREGVFGNNVTSRSAYLPSGAKKSWLDVETRLPSGRLDEFYFYVASDLNSSVTALYLQIWRPTVGAYKYLLAWQKKITHRFKRNTLITVRLADGFITQQGDRIGWYHTTELGFISFEYAEQHKTLFTKTIQAIDIPEVSKVYEFDNIHLPSTFSVAVRITLDHKDTTTSADSTEVNKVAVVVACVLGVLLLCMIAAFIVYVVRRQRKIPAAETEENRTSNAARQTEKDQQESQYDHIILAETEDDQTRITELSSANREYEDIGTTAAEATAFSDITSEYLHTRPLPVNSQYESLGPSVDDMTDRSNVYQSIKA